MRASALCPPEWSPLPPCCCEAWWGTVAAGCSVFPASSAFGPHADARTPTTARSDEVSTDAMRMDSLLCGRRESSDRGPDVKNRTHLRRQGVEEAEDAHVEDERSGRDPRRQFGHRAPPRRRGEGPV